MDKHLVSYMNLRYDQLSVDWEVAWDLSQQADDERDGRETGTTANDTKADGVFMRWEALNDELMRVERVVKGREEPSRKDRQGAAVLAKRHGTLLR